LKLCGEVELLEAEACEYEHGDNFEVSLKSYDFFSDRGLFPDGLLSVRATAFKGKAPLSGWVDVNAVSFEVYIYRMWSNLEPLEDDGVQLQGDISRLPNSRFDGLWEGWDTLLHYLSAV
jgi:hypothetical protein